MRFAQDAFLNRVLYKWVLPCYDLTSLVPWKAGAGMTMKQADIALWLNLLFMIGILLGAIWLILTSVILGLLKLIFYLSHIEPDYSPWRVSMVIALILTGVAAVIIYFRHKST